MTFAKTQIIHSKNEEYQSLEIGLDGAFLFNSANIDTLFNMSLLTSFHWS